MNTSFQAQTDKKNTFKVESAILYAEWLCPAAVAGNDCPVCVKTAMVGNGAPVEIKGRSSKGKAPGNIKGTIINNMFTGELQIPDKIDPSAEFWFEVKLPKHGLSDESNSVPGRPQIIISKMGWDRSTIKRDENTTLSIEFDSPVDNDTDADVFIYEYDQDGNHDPVTQFKTTVNNKKIELTWHFTYFSDTDDIPTDSELKKYNRAYNPPQFFFVVNIDGVSIGKNRKAASLYSRTKHP